MLAPVTIPVPGGKANERVVDLVHESPDPIHPERLEAVDGRASNQRLTALQIRRQPAEDPLRHLFVDATILLESEPTTDPGAVGLVPHTPVPVPHRLTTPLLDTVPDDVGASASKAAQRPGIVK